MNSYKAHMKKETRQTGFTLVELMVTMAVLIITLAVGIPFYNDIVNHNRVIALTNSLTTSVNLAKSEAVGRGNDVFLCANGGTEASPSCGSDWNNGWYVYEDSNVSDDVILKVWPAVETGMRIYSTDNSLQFDYSGALESGDAEFVVSEADSAGKIQTSLNYVRCVGVKYSGRINQNTPVKNKPNSGDNSSFAEGTTTLAMIKCP